MEAPLRLFSTLCTTIFYLTKTKLSEERRELLLVSFCCLATHIVFGVKEGSLVWPVCLLASLSLSEWIIQLFPLCGQFAE